MSMLKRLRTQRGITQRSLAQQAGIAPETLSRIEAGKQDARETLWKLLAVLLEADPMSLRSKTFAGAKK
jgi:transcriptional regulator with XRE-family HTH domain